MKKPVIVGDKNFKHKKDALLYYRRILNSYEYGEVLGEADFADVMALLRLHEKSEEKIGVGVRKILVEQVRYKTKCFKIIRIDATCDVFSYIKCVNGRHSPTAKFNRTCRDLIQEDLRHVKEAYFKAHSKKGKVKCQETGEWCLWEELNIDHRQPNTFSVIVDRFLELTGIDVYKVNYIEVMDAVYAFEDDSLSQSFRKYHHSKANLRLVKKGKNLGRSHQGRLGRQRKDLTVEKEEG
jgi:hypothetical protein